MRNTARCGTGHDRPESAVTIAGIRILGVRLSLNEAATQDLRHSLQNPR
jgi:hypothetical protein